MGSVLRGAGTGWGASRCSGPTKQPLSGDMDVRHGTHPSAHPRALLSGRLHTSQQHAASPTHLGIHGRQEHTRPVQEGMHEGGAEAAPEAGQRPRRDGGVARVEGRQLQVVGRKGGVVSEECLRASKIKGRSGLRHAVRVRSR